MMTTAFNTNDTVPQMSWEPPSPPPSRHEMIETLEKHNHGIFGPHEDFDNMTNADLWKRYQKWRELMDSINIY